MSTTTHSHLICYLGRNNSGKSYRANQLAQTQNYIKVSMADALRELAWKILRWRPVDEYDYQDFKNSYFNLTPYCFSNWDDLTGRQFLQNLGQGCKDLFGEDFWVKKWEKKVLENGRFEMKSETGKYITTDDIRFPIEVKSAHRLGATFIWCDYQKGSYSIEEHSSEALANRILASGKYKDGDEIGFEELKTFFE